MSGKAELTLEEIRKLLSSAFTLFNAATTITYDECLAEIESMQEILLKAEKEACRVVLKRRGGAK